MTNIITIYITIYRIMIATAFIGGLLAGFPVILAEAGEEGSEVFALPAMIDEVLRKNPELLAAKAQWEASREEIVQARSLEDPQFSITQADMPHAFSVQGARETRYGIEQGLSFPGKRSLKAQVTTKEADAVEQAYQAKIREVVAAAKTVYDQLFLVHKTIEIHRMHEALLEEFIRSAMERYAVGQVSQQDVLKAQVELSTLHNGLLRVDQEKVSVRARINALLDRPPGIHVGIPADLEYHPFSWTLEALQDQASRKRPELQSAALRVEKGRLNQLLAGKNVLPDFMVGFEYSDVQDGSNLWMMTGKMNLPWVFRSKVDARVRQAAAEERQARAEYVNLRNETQSRIQELFEDIKTSETLILGYQGGVLPQAEQSLEAARIGYAAGKADFLNLIDSERTLLDIQLDYYATIARFYQTVADLERIVGSDLTL